MTNHPAIRAALIAATGTLALMAAACGASGTSSSAQSGTSASASPSAGAGEVTTGDTGTGNGGGTTTTSPTPTPKTNTTTAASGPQIVSFKVSKQPMCPVVSTDPAAPFNTPGQDLTLSWKVTGATKVALSVDGPGIYRDDYGQEDSQQLSFGCDTSKPQSTHKYILTVTGGGSTKTQTLTVTIQSKP